MKVLPGAEAPYLADGWKISKKLKRFIRLAKAKTLDRQFEDRVWRFFYKMGYEHRNKGHDFKIVYKAADEDHSGAIMFCHSRKRSSLSSLRYYKPCSQRHC